jgi:linoleoyl-CoA desaturase
LPVLKEQPIAVKALPFTKQLGFRKLLNERVDAYLRASDLPARDVPAMYVKTAVMFVWWLASYLLIVYSGWAGLSPWVSALLVVIYAFAVAGIGLNVMHDANHGGYSNNPRVNKLLGYTMELLGSSSFIWKQKHNVWHHTYTNIAGLDADIETQGSIRLSPQEPWKPFYRLQVFYAPFLYGLLGFDFLVRDFRVYFTGKSDAYHVYPPMSQSDKIVFWCGKIVFFAMTLLIPLLFFPWWQVLIGFFLFVFTIGLLLAAVFQLAHVVEPADFPEPIGDPLRIENEWAIHEVETTVDFAPRNRVLNWYVGGLNYQIEHHLFPHICHMHYPQLAPIVKQTCEEFGVQYHVYPTYREALAAHFQALRLFGRKPGPASADAPSATAASSVPAK